MAKIKPAPTPAQLKKFAKKFSKVQWTICCTVPAFMEALEVDLNVAEKYALRILNGEWIQEIPYVDQE